MGFSFVEKPEGNIKVYYLKGEIDRDTNLPPLKTDSDIVLDMDGVTSINSVGVRKWVGWINTYTTIKKIMLQKCHYSILLQISTVKGFLPTNAQVTSFFLTYYSEELDLEKDTLFELDKNYTYNEINIQESITLTVNGKSSKFELDTLPKKTITFIKNVNVI